VKTVYFNYDRFDIRPDQIPGLEKSAKFIKKQSRTILIEGHCDERGTIEYNMSLGQKRAEAVKAFLVSQGVDEAKLTTISRGKEMPAMPGDNEAARSKNRRCEFYYNSK
jgi:peptidoglycan-associated lipoprotein